MSTLFACAATDWIQAGAIVAATIVAAVGTCIAKRGLETWREQLRGNVRHDAALGLLEKTFAVRDALQTIRRHAVFAGPGVGCSVAEAQEAVDQMSVPVLQAMREMDIARVRADAVFGSDVIRPMVKPFQGMIGKTRVGVEHEILNRAEGQRQALPRESGVGWSSDDPDHDAWTARLHESLEELESWARAELS